MRYELHGVERTTSRWDKDLRDLVSAHVSRIPGQGLYVRAGELGKADLFRVEEFSGWQFCTDPVKHFIEKRAYTNIAFEEYGEVI